eukprot:gene6444-3073_t
MAKLLYNLAYTASTATLILEGEGLALTSKNVAALRVLFNLAHRLNDCLGFSWIYVIDVINCLEQQLDDLEDPVTDATGPINSELAILSSAVNQLFENTSLMSTSSVVALLSTLGEVSMRSLPQQARYGQAQLYSLNRMVDTLLRNHFRLQELWGLILAHVLELLRSPNPQVRASTLEALDRATTGALNRSAQLDGSPPMQHVYADVRASTLEALDRATTGALNRSAQLDGSSPRQRQVLISTTFGADVEDSKVEVQDESDIQDLEPESDVSRGLLKIVAYVLHHHGEELTRGWAALDSLYREERESLVSCGLLKIAALDSLYREERESDVSRGLLKIVTHVLHHHGEELTRGWVPLMRLLEAVPQQAEPALITLGFQCVELVVSDFLPSMPKEYIPRTLNTVALFAKQDIIIIIALTAATMDIIIIIALTAATMDIIIIIALTAATMDIIIIIALTAATMDIIIIIALTAATMDIIINIALTAATMVKIITDQLAHSSSMHININIPLSAATMVWSITDQLERSSSMAQFCMLNFQLLNLVRWMFLSPLQHIKINIPLSAATMDIIIIIALTAATMNIHINIPLSAATMYIILTVSKAAVTMEIILNVSLTAVTMVWSMSDQLARSSSKAQPARQQGSAQAVTHPDWKSGAVSSHPTLSSNLSLSTASSLLPTIVSTSRRMDISEEEVVEMLMTSFRALKQTSLDDRPEVRNSSVRTLFLAVGSHGSKLPGNTLREVMWEMLFPLVCHIHLLSYTSSCEEVQASELGREKSGKSVMMLMHHSRNTEQKQWDETLVLRAHLLALSALEGFQKSWEHVMQVMGDLLFAARRGVASAASSLITILITSMVTQPQMPPRMWRQAMQAIDKGVVTMASPNTHAPLQSGGGPFRSPPTNQTGTTGVLAEDPILEARALSPMWMARICELVTGWFKDHVGWQDTWSLLVRAFRMFLSGHDLPSELDVLEPNVDVGGNNPLAFPAHPLSTPAQPLSSPAADRSTQSVKAGPSEDFQGMVLDCLSDSVLLMCHYAPQDMRQALIDIIDLGAAGPLLHGGEWGKASAHQEEGPPDGRFSHVCLSRLHVLCCRGQDTEQPREQSAKCQLEVAQLALPVFINRCEVVLQQFVQADAEVPPLSSPASNAVASPPAGPPPLVATTYTADRARLVLKLLMELQVVPSVTNHLVQHSHPQLRPWVEIARIHNGQDPSQPGIPRTSSFLQRTNSNSSVDSGFGGFGSLLGSAVGAPVLCESVSVTDATVRDHVGVLLARVGVELGLCHGVVALPKGLMESAELDDVGDNETRLLLRRFLILSVLPDLIVLADLAVLSAVAVLPDMSDLSALADLAAPADQAMLSYLAALADLAAVSHLGALAELAIIYNP